MKQEGEDREGGREYVEKKMKEDNQPRPNDPKNLNCPSRFARFRLLPLSALK